MPRTERFGVGTKIDTQFLELLEILRRATYTKTEQKITLLQHALIRIDSVRFFLQLSWEMQLVSNKKYISISEKIDEIGRMVGGWKKGLKTKTSLLNNREER